MAATVSANYTATGTNFTYQTADADSTSSFRPIGQAFEEHQHRSTRGLGIGRLITGSAPTVSGEVDINGDDLRYWAGTTAAAWTVAATARANSFSAAQTFSRAGLLATLTNTTDGASSQVAIFEGDRATVAANDEAYVSLRLSDSAGNQDEFGRLTWVAVDATSTSEDGRLELDLMLAGTLTRLWYFEGRSLVCDQVTGDITITVSDPAASRTLTLPDPGANDTFVFLAATQTLTNKTLTSPTIQGTVAAGTGLTLPAFTLGGTLSRAADQTIDLTGAATRTLTVQNSTASQVANVDVDGTYLWRNNTAFTMQITGTPTANRVFTFPDVANDTVVLLAATQTLTNKTLTAPTIQGTVAAGTGLTMPAFTLGGAVTLNSQTFSGTAAGDHTYSGIVTFSRAGNTTLHTNTTDGASVQVSVFEGDRSTVAANDEAYISLRISDSSGTQDEFARLTWRATTVTAGSEAARLAISVMTAGTLAEEIYLTGTALSPAANDGNALGTSTLGWADLFLASGGVIDFAASDVTITHATDTLTFAGAASGYVFNNGILFLADTSNASMTAGLTINQSGADNEILSLKSSDIAHGFTSRSETDTFFMIQKQDGATGGVQLWAFRETTGGDVPVLHLIALGGVETTTASTTALALATVTAQPGSGTDTTNAAANSLIFGVRSQVAGAGRALFFVDAEGDLFVDGSTTLTAFDQWDDVALVRAFDIVRTPGQLIRDEWDQYVTYNRRDLVAAGILSTPDPDAMVNITQLQRLHNGAIWQLGKHQKLLERQIAQLEDQLAVAHGRLALLEAP